MRCPRCQNHEPPGSTTCRMCFSSLEEAPVSAEVAVRRARATAQVRAGAPAGSVRTAAVRSWPPPDDAGAAKSRVHTGATAGLPALRRRTDVVAAAAFVAGILALGPVAMLLGLWGRHRVHSHAARSGYALASVGLWLGLAATLVYFWLLMDRGGSTLGSV